MKKGKEFTFPENVDKDFGIWKDYTLKDFTIAGIALIACLALFAIPPYTIVLILAKVAITLLAMTVVMAILTIRPIKYRKNIKVRDNLNLKRRYKQSQKLYFLEPKKRGGKHADDEIN
ncbi:MAG: conjugal transfer protein [Tetragenococcus koreensis]|nr:conjugal transfer protein [Tetragenococcus koreensis]MDN6269853.1 conjugal transfer protein [Tetragenococcus koreensis]